MIDRNFIVKNPENISEHNAKNFPWWYLPLPRNRQTAEMWRL